MTAAIWNSLILTIGGDPKRYDEALALEPAAEIAIQRADGVNVRAIAELRAELLYAIGAVNLNKGDYARAVVAFEAVLELPTGALDEQSLPNALNALGGAYLRTGNIFAAKETFERSESASRDCT